MAAPAPIVRIPLAHIVVGRKLGGGSFGAVYAGTILGAPACFKVVLDVQHVHMLYMG